MKIRDIRATTVTVPLEAAVRHSNGVHWGRFVRTIVEVETDTGIVGVGEMGGGGLSAEQAIVALKQYLVGHNPFDFTRLRHAICNPTASLYNNRTQIHAAIEFACLDIVGKALGVPVYDLLGGKVRDTVAFASYLFFRYPNDDAGIEEIRTADQLVAHATRLKREHGFSVHKLKGGVYPPAYELACYRALAEAFPEDNLRFDPNGALSINEALEFARGIADLRNDYFEDPTFGLGSLRAIREKTKLLLATNTVVIDFEQLAANVRDPAVDVVLLDTTFWGGIRACVEAAAICKAFGIGVAVHSSGELGIQLATMLHLGAVVPNLTFAADAHYHHIADDIIVGGKLKYRDGAIAVPTGPGLGVEIDRDRLAYYADLYKSLGSYPYDRDPGRPGWYPLVPNSDFADPSSRREAEIAAANPATRIPPAFSAVAEPLAVNRRRSGGAKP